MSTKITLAAALAALLAPQAVLAQAAGMQDAETTAEMPMVSGAEGAMASDGDAMAGEGAMASDGGGMSEEGGMAEGGMAADGGAMAGEGMASGEGMAMEGMAMEGMAEPDAFRPVGPTRRAMDDVRGPFFERVIVGPSGIQRYPRVDAISINSVAHSDVLEGYRGSSGGTLGVSRS